MPAVSIVLLNQKGGVGKTSTCHHLAGTLAKDGKRILLVDNDPQASLTQGLFGPQATRDLDPGQTIAAVYRAIAVPEQIIHRTEIAGIDLVPGSRHAMKYNNAEPWAADRDLQIGLRDVVEAVRDRYDLVLIDCPPNLHLCSLGGAGRRATSSDRAAPARGLRCAGHHRRPGVGGPGHRAGQPRPVAPGLPDHDVQRPQVDPQDVRGDAPGPVRGRRLRDAHPARRRVPRGDRLPQADRPVQAQGRGRQGDQGAGRRDSMARLEARRGRTRGRPPDEQARRTAPRGRRQRRREHGGRGRPPVAGWRACRSRSAAPGTRTSSKAKNAFEVPVDKIVPDPNQPRKVFTPEDLQDLSDSIRARGLLQPIRVRWDEEREKYVIVAGERRWRAAIMAGKATLTCVIVEGEMAESRDPPRSARRELPPGRPPAHRAGRGVQGA